MSDSSRAMLTPVIKKLSIALDVAAAFARFTEQMGTWWPLDTPRARPMDFTRKPLKGFVYVDADGTADDGELDRWIDTALEFVLSLPAKA